jgi:hypothetical protein
VTGISTAGAAGASCLPQPSAAAAGAAASATLTRTAAPRRAHVGKFPTEALPPFAGPARRAEEDGAATAEGWSSAVGIAMA